MQGLAETRQDWKQTQWECQQVQVVEQAGGGAGRGTARVMP